MEYRHEHGRRYHSFEDGTYMMPNDDAELQRLDLQHNQWRMTLNGRLYIAPLLKSSSKRCPPGYRVLDIGTGTGVWAREFAEENPEAQVTGIDLSPVQPATVPANCSFFVRDVESTWAYDQEFDFIHGRFLTMGIRDWSRVFKQSMQNLKPGGWVEYQEAELSFPLAQGSPKGNPEMQSLSDDVKDAAARIGVGIRQAHGWKEAIEQVGFVNHKMVRASWPLGEWHQEAKQKVIGRMNRLNMLNGIEGITMAYLVRIRGDPVEEVRQRLERVRAEMKDDNVHMSMPLFVISVLPSKNILSDPLASYIHYAQKPL